MVEFIKEFFVTLIYSLLLCRLFWYGRFLYFIRFFLDKMFLLVFHCI